MNKLTEVSVKNDCKATCNHYRKLIYQLFLILLIFLLTSPVQAKYSGGTGEPNAPYLIATAMDLNDIGNHVEDFNKCFVMVNDVNLSEYTGTEFNIIGPNSTTPFTGVFDGNGHAISNFTFSSTTFTTDMIGLFGVVDAPNGVIKNLKLIGCDVNSVNMWFVAGLVGRNYGLISNCSVTGMINGNSSNGGLVGYNYSGSITNCFAACTVNGDSYTGGLVGSSLDGNILNCYAASDVNGNVIVGGLLGKVMRSTVSNCYSSSKVNGNESFGGFVGNNSADGFGVFVKCFWDESLNPDVNGIGIGIISDPNVIGKPTSEMKIESTFTDAGWDFVEIWNIGENQTYPYLRIYPAGDLNHDGHVNWLDFAIFANHWIEDNNP